MKLIRLENVDSTNTYIKQLARTGLESPCAVLAEYQSGGRGRLGRSFCSPRGKGIYLSVYKEFEGLTGDITCITAMTAVAVSSAIAGVYGEVPDIKWVNDLLVNKKKVCGILTEGIPAKNGRYAVVIGIGINVDTGAEDFAPELSGIASSLALEFGVYSRREALTEALVGELDLLLGSFPGCKSEYLRLYRERCITPGHEVSIIRAGDIVGQGFAECVNDDFRLSVRREDGILTTIDSGEASIRDISGDCRCTKRR